MFPQASGVCYGWPAGLPHNHQTLPVPLPMPFRLSRIPFPKAEDRVNRWRATVDHTDIQRRLKKLVGHCVGPKC